MRFTHVDVDLLCDQFMAGKNTKAGACFGCKLHEQLQKPPAERSKTFLARMESRVKKLRRTRSVT